MTNTHEERIVALDGTYFRVCANHDDCDFVDPVRRLPIGKSLANSPVAKRLNGYMEQRTKYLALKGAEVEEKELQEGKSVEKRIAELPMISEKFMETLEELDIPIPWDLQDEDDICFDCRIGELEQRVQELEQRVSHLNAQKARHIRRKAGE